MSVPPSSSEEFERAMLVPRRHRLRVGGRFWLGAFSGLLFAGTVALDVRTVRRAFHVQPALGVPPIVALPPGEAPQRAHDVIGTFVTGSDPGDRTITVTADGRIQFSVVGPFAAALTSTDTFTLGRTPTQIILATAHSGAVAFLDIDTLQYCDDVYSRDLPGNDRPRPVHQRMSQGVTVSEPPEGRARPENATPPRRCDDGAAPASGTTSAAS